MTGASPKQHEAFLRAYTACALWSTHYANEVWNELPLDDGVHGTSPATALQFKVDCRAFVDVHWETIEDGSCRPDGDPYEQAGHDFWLNRNGHGAGFWDGDWAAPGADILDEASAAAGPVDLYVGDDKFIYH
jgi:hypothetical protein